LKTVNIVKAAAKKTFVSMASVPSKKNKINGALKQQ